MKNDMNTVRIAEEVDIDLTAWTEGGVRCLRIKGRESAVGPELYVDIDLHHGAVADLEDLVMGTQPVTDDSKRSKQLAIVQRGLESWHDSAHAGPFRTCQREPCVEVCRDLEALGRLNAADVVPSRDLSPNLFGEPD